MKQGIRILLVGVILIGAAAFVQKNSKDGGFVENFNRSSSKNFKRHTGGKGGDSIWKFGVRSPSEQKTKVLSLKIDPEDPAGAGRGPEIISNDITHFRTYVSRLKIPDVRNIQPDAGAVIGYFTYHVDDTLGLSEIDFEFLAYRQLAG